MKALALLVGQLLQRRGDVGVGSAVPVGFGVVPGVIARALGLVFVPLLGHRDAGNHRLLDTGGVHGLDQRGHAFAFLEEVDVVQVGITVAVVTRLRRLAQPGG